MKKIPAILLAVLVMFQITSCGEQDKEKVPTWQEQYDLGLRYLEEGNYEEAILAFTAAIEIDPKQAPAYVGRGDAYMLSGETEDNLTAAQADYEKAIELDETNADAYLGLADVYIRQGKYTIAREILQNGIDCTSNAKLQELLQEILFLGDEFANSNFFEFEKFDDLNPEAQDLIMALVSSCINNSFETTMDLLTVDYTKMLEQGFIAKFIRTFWNESRIQISYLQRDDIIVGGVLQVRPMSGTAYYCHAQIIDGQLEFSYCTGNCEDWNWNGSFETAQTVVGGYVYYESGNCVNGLRDGPVHNTISQEWLDAIPNAANNYDIYYDMGKEIKTIFDDGSESPANAYSDNDVFVVTTRTSVSNYERMWLW